MSSNWNDLQYFLAIYQQRSLVKAAKVLKVDETTVGRRLAALEQDLGVKLFERKKTGFTPTQAGLKVLQASLPIQKQLRGLKTEIEGQDQRLRGSVKITMPESMATLTLMPRLQEFLTQYPELNLEIITSTQTINVSKREADIAIRMFKPSGNTLYAKRLGKLRFAFFERDAGAINPDTPTLLDYAESVATDEETKLLKKLKCRFKSRLIFNSRNALYAAIQSGLGIGMIPEPTAKSELGPRLKLHSEITPIDLDVWMVVHSDLKTNARVKVTADFLKSVFASSLR